MRALVEIVSAAVVLGAAGCGAGSQGPVASEGAARMQADHVVVAVRHFVTADGVRQARLEADTAYIYEDEERTDLRKVHLVLYNANGQEAATLTSHEGELNPRTQKLIARGEVVLVTAEGKRRIETEELHYDPSQARLWSDVPTTMTEEGRIIRGDGFSADTPDGQLRNIRVTRPSGQLGEVKIEF